MLLGLKDSPLQSAANWIQRTLLIALVLIATMAGFPAPAIAAPAVQVELGYNGRHTSGADLLVQVVVDADQLIDGELRITLPRQGSATTVVLPVQIAGGARKLFSAVIPAVGQWENQLTVQLIDGGTVISSTEHRVDTTRDGDELIGVFPSLAGRDMPATGDLAVPLGLARFHPIDETLLATGPGALDALSTVIGTAADLEQLSSPARTSLETWIRVGGRLIVDEGPGPVPGFAVSATDAGTPFGLGEIQSSNGAFGRSEWSGTIAPTRLRLSDGGNGDFVGELTGETVWFGGPLANSLASAAGFGLPSLSVVLPSMAIYALVIGPLAFFILKRLGRSGWLWLTLPGLALLFTVAVWLGGSALRSGTNDAHGTVIQIDNGSAVADSTVLRSSRNGGNTSIALAAGWKADKTSDDRFGSSNSSETIIRPTPGGTDLEATLDAGEFILLRGAGPAPAYDDAVEVTAVAAESGRITGTITNRLDVMLEEVAVFTGFQGNNIGRIGPGETVSFELSGADRDPMFGEPIEFRVWRDALNQNDFGPFGPQGFDQETSVVNVELWGSFLSQNLGRVRQQGVVTVAGWTTELPSPIDGAITQGSTAVVIREPVAIVDDVLVDIASHRTLLRGPDQIDFQPGFGDTFEVPSAWRFDVPAGVALDRVVLELPNSVTSLDLWDGTEWRVLENPTAGQYALPPGAYIDGSIFAKVEVDFNRSPMLGRNFSLATATEPLAVSGELLEGADAQ